tara:strand:+ start:48 stop:494 length:447 start_codon:yes stop_codon:yes gene_type:complete
MRHLTIDDFDEAWKVFHDNKFYFPHVRASHIRTRLERGQLILQNNILITYHKNKNNRKIGQDTDVSVTAGSYTIHQLINATPHKGNAVTVMNEFFNFAGTDVYLTVRTEANNLVANRFYKKVGMEKVGYITWSKGKMLGNVWKKEKGA